MDRETKLFDLVTLECNNSHCVILKVKEDGAKMDLIRLGCFNGNETMFRLTKGSNLTYTVFTDDGKSYSWENGSLVVSSMRERARMLRECVMEDFGIEIR